MDVYIHTITGSPNLVITTSVKCDDRPTLTLLPELSNSQAKEQITLPGFTQQQ